VADADKPRRPRRSRFMEGPDQVLRLQSLYRSQVLANDRTGNLTRSSHASLDNLSTADPGADLEDSEISDAERRQAMARERMRREGRV
jgi:hypothetical protein